MNRDILNSLQNRFILGISLTVITMVLVLATVIRTSAGNMTAEDEGTEYYKYTTMYRVGAGDTLTSIADEYMDDIHYSSRSEYIREIMKMNGMTSDDEIRSGELICVCYYSSELR